MLRRGWLDVSPATPDTGHPHAQDRLENTPLSECMTKKPQFLDTASTLDDALFIMERLKIGALPVVNDGRRVVGVFSVQDLMKAYRRLFGLGEEGSAFLESFSVW